MLPLLPPVMSQTPDQKSFVVEEVVLPKALKNSWVVIEYSGGAPALDKDATYRVGPSGYLKVKLGAPNLPSKLRFRVEDGDVEDAYTSAMIHRLHRANSAHASATGGSRSRSFLVFFYGEESQIVDNWMHHIPK